MLRSPDVPAGGYKIPQLQRFIHRSHQVIHRLRSVIHRLSTGYPQGAILAVRLVVAAVPLSGCRNLVRDFPSSTTNAERGGSVSASLLRAKDGLTTVCVSLEPHNLQP
jgi:hypothetical protein